MAGALLLALIVIHGVVPEEFTVDATTVALLTLLAAVIALPYLPQISRYISELTFMGNTVKFREKMEQAEEQLGVVEANAEADQEAPRPPHRAIGGDGPPDAEIGTWPRFVDVGEHLRRLLDDDPKLAVAGLGIELEKILREAAGRAAGGDPEWPRSLTGVIRLLRRRELIDGEQEALLRQLVEVRNLAVHGAQISRDDAERFFSIVDRLNDSVVLGYSINVSPNPDWEKQGMICQYEHCIERMPLHGDPWTGACPVFGHDCPGGTHQVAECKAAGRSAENPMGERMASSEA